MELTKLPPVFLSLPVFRPPNTVWSAINFNLRYLDGWEYETMVNGRAVRFQLNPSIEYQIKQIYPIWTLGEDAIMRMDKTTTSSPLRCVIACRLKAFARMRTEKAVKGTNHVSTVVRRERGERETQTLQSDLEVNQTTASTRLFLDGFREQKARLDKAMVHQKIHQKRATVAKKATRRRIREGIAADRTRLISGRGELEDDRKTMYESGMFGNTFTSSFLRF